MYSRQAGGTSPVLPNPGARGFPSHPTFTDLEVGGGELVKAEKLSLGLVWAGVVDRCLHFFFFFLISSFLSSRPLPPLCLFLSFFSLPFLSPSTLLSPLFRNGVPRACASLLSFWDQGECESLSKAFTTRTKAGGKERVQEFPRAQRLAPRPQRGPGTGPLGEAQRGGRCLAGKGG